MQLLFVICLIGLAVLCVSAQSNGCDEKSCSINLSKTFFRFQRGRVSRPRQQAVHRPIVHSRPVARPRLNVRSRPVARRPRPNVRSRPRPNIRSRPRPNVRPRTKTRVTKVRSRRPVARRPAVRTNNRRPQIKNRQPYHRQPQNQNGPKNRQPYHRQPQNQNGPRNPTQNNPQQVQKPKLGAGTVSNNNGQNPIGPNEIKVPEKAIAISDLVHASNEVQKISAKFEEITKYTEKVVQKMDEMSTSIENDGTVANHLELGNTGKNKQFDLFQISARFSYPGKFINSADDALTYVEYIEDGISYVVQTVRNTYNTVRSWSTYQSSGSYYIAVRNHQASSRNESNSTFSHFLDSFVVDFGNTIKDVTQIQTNLNSSAAGFVTVANAIKKANSADEHVENIREKISEAKSQFSKIHIDILTAGQSFKLIASDFNLTTDAISKGKDPPPRTKLENLDPDEPETKNPEPNQPNQPQTNDPEPKQPDQPKDPYEDQMKKSAIVLKDYHGTYLSFKSEKTKMGCDKQTPGATERFHIIELPDNKIAFRASNNKFCALSKQPHEVYCNKNNPVASAQFTKLNHNGKAAFKCSNGKSLTSDSTDEQHILGCIYDQVDKLESFDIINVTE